MEMEEEKKVFKNINLNHNTPFKCKQTKSFSNIIYSHTKKLSIDHNYTIKFITNFIA